MSVYAIRPPAVITPSLATTLRRFGMVPSQSAMVWPAGAIPVSWDGAGSVAWLTSDEPMLGIAPDHDLRELVLDDEDIARRYRLAPAAKQIHHAFLGGLIEHVLSVCGMAKSAAAHYAN